MIETQANCIGNNRTTEVEEMIKPEKRGNKSLNRNMFFTASDFEILFIIFRISSNTTDFSFGFPFMI